jgi:hypothetical protein
MRKRAACTVDPLKPSALTTVAVAGTDQRAPKLSQIVAECH